MICCLDGKCQCRNCGLQYLTKTKTFMYETDFVLWAEKTAQLLRSRAFEKVDWESVIEEIESLGRSDKRSLRSQVTRVMAHLLKWEYQQSSRTNSWRLSITEGRFQIRQLLKDSPSLKPYLAEIESQCYQDAVEWASAETELPVETFPVACQYSLAQVLNPRFLPSPNSSESDRYE